MALVFIDVIDRCDLPAGSCDNVSLCLVPGWVNKTQDGLAIIAARITRVSKYIIPNTVNIDCCHNVGGCVDECIYQVEINNAQFLIDIGTGLPYAIIASDITEINPYPCHMGKLVSYVTGQADYHVDSVASTLTHNSLANTSTLTLVIANAAGATLPPLVRSLPSGVLSNPAAEVLRYVSTAGKIFNINVTDMIEPSFDGITIVRNALNANKFQVNIPALTPGFTSLTNAPSGAARTQFDDGTIIHQGPQIFQNNDLATAPSINTSVVQSVTVSGGTTWTLNRIPEHGSISSTIAFADQPYVGAGPVNSLKNGVALTKTPAYVEATFANPSSRRNMVCLITCTGSYSALNVAASGIIWWGHSLWINGAAVADRNGRALAGYNISNTVHSSQTEDFILPTIVYSHVIPPLGSVIVGLDFGDNQNFPSAGTTSNIQVESRQISIFGSTGTT